MGAANARGTFEERRNARLNDMVEQAEVLFALRVGEDGTVAMSMLSRDDPPAEESPAVIGAAFLSANWKELMGQAMALSSSAKAAALSGRDDVAGGVIVDSRGRAAGEVRAPIILSADGGVLTADRAQDVRIELPASVKAGL